MLGESKATVEHDRAMLHGALSIESHAGLTIHVIEASGMSLREYVASDGVVFGIAWTHRAGQLSLEQLLGAYYGEYSRAVSAQPRQSHRFQRTSTEHLILERGGRMGASWGRMWIPSLVPRGISEDRIK
jgi:hypothetical protein